MRYLAVLALVAVIGCRSTVTADPAGPMSPEFQPGGSRYVAPGTFVGTWIITTVLSNNRWIDDTCPCTAIVTEADSLAFCTITNNSSGEVLTVSGTVTSPTDGSCSPHLFMAKSTSCFGETNDEDLNFFTTGDTLFYGGYEKPPANSSPTFVIWCYRNKK